MINSTLAGGLSPRMSAVMNRPLPCYDCIMPSKYDVVVTSCLGDGYLLHYILHRTVLGFCGFLSN